MIDTRDTRLARIEKILLGMEWSGIEPYEDWNGDTYFDRQICPLCGGIKVIAGSDYIFHGALKDRIGHRDGCLFLELPR